jgi:short-subunit dehydrogenase
MSNKVWFITGGSQGLGLCLVKQLLADGYQVVASTRSLNKLVAAAGPETKDFFPVEVDLNSDESLIVAREKILAKFETVDVIVNNAGYALRGMLEEVSKEEVQRDFAANVFSVLNVIRNFAGILREKRSGYIFNLASIAGYSAKMWSGIYAATKFAVAGISEALREEMGPFGVHVTCVMPGDLRTTFHDPSKMVIAQKEITDYNGMAEQISSKIKGKNGCQSGSPQKLAAKIIALSLCETPPLNLFAGSDSYNVAKMKIKKVTEELELWKEMTNSIGFNS